MLALSAHGLGQTTAPAERVVAPVADGSSIRISLLTFGPGDLIWERFGHNAIAIQDSADTLRDGSPFDLTFHWGAFTFDGLNFIKNYLLGNLDYSMAVERTGPTLDFYARQGRLVQITELNLSPRQKLALKRAVIRNLENPTYRYDYFRDNCSTRVRDAINTAADGNIHADLVGKPTGTTFRWHMSRILSADPFMYVVLNYILGSPIDRPIDQWQECFLPAKLLEHLESVQVRSEGGLPVKLLGRTEQFSAATAVRVGPRPPAWMPWFLAAGLLGGGAFAALGDLLRRRRIRWGWVAIPVVLWAVFAGLAGSIAVWAWGWTAHVAARANHNILHLNPIALILAVTAIGYLRRGRRERIVLAVIAVMVFLSLADLPLKLFHQQVNGQLIAWILPTHVGLLIALWRLRGRTFDAPKPAATA